MSYTTPLIIFICSGNMLLQVEFGIKKANMSGKNPKHRSWSQSRIGCHNPNAKGGVEIEEQSWRVI